MSWLDAGRHWFRVLFRREDVAGEMDDEVAFHLEMEAMHRRHDGADDAEALRQARLRFGSPAALREDRRRASGLAVIDRIRQDVGYAARQLRHTPGFTVAVVFTFALGIGANATMFTIVDHVMLRAPAGITDAGRVVQLRMLGERGDGTRDSMPFQSYPSYVEFRGMTDVFEHVTAVSGPREVPIGRGPDASTAMAALIGDDYFATLGVRPAAGRFFVTDETREGPTDGPPVVVLSHAYARSRYGLPASTVGTRVIVAGTEYSVVGVAPAGFAGHTLSAADLWIPIAAAPQLRFSSRSGDWANGRGMLWLTVIAKLSDGVTTEAALARAQTSWTAWHVSGRADEVAPRLFTKSLIPAESAARPEHRVARLLALVSLFLLVIACANVANLLLARSLTRRREIAIRLALGVSRLRLAALLAVDAMLLAVLGGAAALLVAHWGTPLVRALLFAGTATARWGMDGRLYLFTAAAALTAGVLAGVVPALQARRPTLVDALRDDVREGGGALRRSRMRVVLLVVQGALSLVLIAGSGLFARSLQRVTAQPLGLDLDKVFVVQLQSWRNGYTDSAYRSIHEAMRDRVRALPGVERASLSVGTPFLGGYSLPLRLPGHDSLPGLSRGRAPFIYAVTPDFFATMGTRIVRGRGLEETDGAGGSVAVVSGSMARLFWPTVDPIGQCFKIVLRAQTSDCTRVVGVAEDAHRSSLVERAGDVQYYMPLTQSPTMMSETTLLVRASHPAAVRAALRRTVQTTRPDLPYVDVQTLEDLVAPELRPWRLGAGILGLFGALALVVAGIGTYSVMQFSVSQRLHEMGLRIALGAQRADIARLVLREELLVTAAAMTLGVALTLVLGSLIRDQLFETSPHDPLVLGAGIAVLAACGLAASLLPAWRATRVDPARTLRAD